MISAFTRLTIIRQASLILVLMGLASMSALYFWASSNARTAELTHSRTVADMVDAYRTQASTHGGFYVRREATEEVKSIGRYLDTYSIEAPTPSGSTRQYVFHLKNPFLALSDYSEAVQAYPNAAQFRMVSDNFMNPANSPDAFEKFALQSLRETKGKELSRVVNNQMRYARPLYATQACLNCHGSADEAPEAVRSMFHSPLGTSPKGGYGYKVGEVVGLTSVTVPHRRPLQMLTSQNLGFWLSVASFALLLWSAYFVTSVWVIRPIRRLTQFAQQTANSNSLDEIKLPRFNPKESSSRNELHIHSQALKTVHERLRRAAPPP